MGSGKSTLLAAAVSIASLASTWQPALASTSYSVHSFAAASYDGVSPADPNLAVGSTYIVETTNTEMVVFSKSGQETSHKEFSELFAPATNVFCGDPRVTYWSWSHRYAIVCSDFGTNQTVRLAVSASSDPNRSWFTYSTGANTVVDQPNVEVAADKLVVGGNISVNGALSSVFWIYQLSDLVAGVTAPRVTRLTNPRGLYQAVQQFTASAIAYFVQAFPGAGNHSFLAQFTGTPATHVSVKISDLGSYPLLPPSEPAIPGGHLGGAGYLDGRVTSAVYEVTKGGTRIIQYSGMAECGSRVCNANGKIILTSTGPVSRSVNTFSEASYDGTYGAVTVDGDGRAFEIYSRSNSTQAPQAALATGASRTVLEPSIAGATACNAGVGPPCDERWGDYLGATQDPSNPETLWFVGLYQTASGQDGWTTVISSVVGA
jgi:hypothetical protein